MADPSNENHPISRSCLDVEYQCQCNVSQLENRTEARSSLIHPYAPVCCLFFCLLVFFPSFLGNIFIIRNKKNTNIEYAILVFYFPDRVHSAR